MKKQELFDTVLGTLAPKYGDVETELHFATPFQLLVAVVLSAQCTDKRVNMITPALFEAYPDADAMAQATPEELLEYIKSVSYPNSKAKHLAGLAQMLVETFNVEVPTTLEALTRLQEMALKKYIPEEKVAPSHFWLLLHGRYVCTALRPKCDKCDLRGLCKGPLQIKKR